MSASCAPHGYERPCAELCQTFYVPRSLTAIASAPRSSGARRARSRSIPWIGAAIAIVTVGSAIRRKGFVRGLIHSGLDFIADRVTTPR